MKRTEETTAKHLSFSASSLHLLQRKAFVLPSCLGRWRGLSFALLLTVSLTLSTSVKAQNNNSTVNRTEISTKSGDNKEKSNKYSMPSIYKDKLSNFLQEEKNLFFYTRINDVPASKYTVDFVLKEMDSDWGITKDNQLLFIWHCVYGVITGKDLYDGEDGDSKRLGEFEKVLDHLDACESRYKEGIMPFAEKLFAEYDRRSAEARQQSIDKGLEALTKIINGFENYITLFQNMINLDGATQTLANFNQEKNALLQRAEILRSGLQSTQHPSATEAENLKKIGEQLLSDLTNQRIIVVKQIYAVIEKNIPEIEKRINSSDHEIVEAKQEIVEAKQKIAETQKAIADSKLTSAEDGLRFIMASLRSAEARKESAETQSEIIKITIIRLNNLVEFYGLYKKDPSSVKQDELKFMQRSAKEIIQDCKEYDIDYKSKLSSEVRKFFGVE